MKNLLLVFLLATSVVATGQNDKRKMKAGQKFTTEQQAILKTKKMTFAFDLNENQQSEILALNKKWIEEKEATMTTYKNASSEEMTSDQRFELMSKRLDSKIQQQQELKKVFDKDQYQLWKESTLNQQRRSKGKGKQGHQKQHKNQKD